MIVAILGAGLAGLSAAYHLDTDYEIFESQAEAGGLCRSLKENGFVIDYGPHLFFSKDKYVTAFLDTLLNRNLHELESNTGQYSFGRYMKYPYNVNLYGAPVEKIKECILGYIDARNKLNTKKPKTYHDWCLYHFGKGYAQNFMFPYANKIWTINPKKMTTDWIGKRIVMPSLEQILEGALHKSEAMLNYIGTFRYPIHGGMASMIESLASRTKPIHYNKRIELIDIKNKKLTFQDGTSSYYEKAISTIPLPEVIKMIPDVPASVRDAANRLINNSVYIINIGVDRRDLSEYQWIYYDGNEPFYRIHFPKMLSGFNAPKSAGAISVEIAYSRFKPLHKKGLFKLTVNKLKNAGILRSSDNIIYKSDIDLKYAYVIYDKNRKTSVNKIRSYLRRHGIETCGRFGEWGYLWMDQCIHSGKHAAETISKLKS